MKRVMNAARGSLQVLEDTVRKDPLHSAIQDTKKRALHGELERLIKGKQDLNYRDWQQNTPLHIAVECGNFRAVELLVQHGAKVNLENCFRKTPLQIAKEKLTEKKLREKKSYEDIILFLQTQPFKVLSERSKEEDKLHKLGQFIQQGFDVNSQDEHGNTLLHIAIEKNYLKIVKYLVDDAQAKINLKNRSSLTPLLLAQKKKRTEIAEYLLTCFHRAVIQKQDHTVFLQLLDQGFDVNAQNPTDGDTALHQAIIANDLDAVRWLVVDFNADLNVANNEKYTPLQAAEFLEKKNSKHKEVAAFLRLPPLHRAIKVNTDKRHLLRLINNNPNSLQDLDDQKNTVWHVAVGQANLEILNLLLALSPRNALDTNSEGMSPVDLVNFSGSNMFEEDQKKVLQFFLQHDHLQPEWATHSRDLGKLLKERKHLSDGLKQIEFMENTANTNSELLESVVEQIKQVREGKHVNDRSKQIEQNEKKSDANSEVPGDVTHQLKKEEDKDKLNALTKRHDELIKTLEENKQSIKILREKYGIYRYDPIFFARNCLERLSFSVLYQAASFFINPPPQPTILPPPPPMTYCEMFHQTFNHLLYGPEPMIIVEPIVESRNSMLLISMGVWAVTSSIVNTVMQAHLKMNDLTRDILSYAIAGSVIIPTAYYFGNVDVQEMALFAAGSIAIELIYKASIPVMKLAAQHFVSFGNWMYQKVFDASSTDKTSVVINRKEEKIA